MLVGPQIESVMSWSVTYNVIASFCVKLVILTFEECVAMTTNNRDNGNNVDEDDVVVCVGSCFGHLLTCHHNGHIILTLIPHFRPQDIFRLMS